MFDLELFLGTCFENSSLNTCKYFKVAFQSLLVVSCFTACYHHDSDLLVRKRSMGLWETSLAIVNFYIIFKKLILFTRGRQALIYEPQFGGAFVFSDEAEEKM